MTRSPATRLALFRIVVAGVILASRQVWDAVTWASLPAELRFPPLGLAWLSQFMTPATARIALVVVAVSGAAALAGLASRAAMALLCASSYFLLGIPQLAGAIVHHHHLVWFTALLAASPCGDALSLDARFFGRPLRPDRAYAAPIWGARILIGIIFFFPGLWKLLTSGWAWIAGDNLRNLLWWKWTETGAVPFFRLDHYPALCHALAFAAVAFELTFPFAIFVRRLRPFAVAGALAFHAGTWLFLHIDFSTLWPCYVVFLEARPAGVPGRARPLTVATAALLAAAAVGFGARGVMNAWPFACYPTFQDVAPAVIPGVAAEGVTASGEVIPIPDPPPDRLRDHQRWGMAWRVAGLGGPPPSPAALAAYAARLPLPEGVVRVRLYRALYLASPDARGAPPVARQLLGEVSAARAPAPPAAR